RRQIVGQLIMLCQTTADLFSGVPPSNWFEVRVRLWHPRAPISRRPSRLVIMEPKVRSRTCRAKTHIVAELIDQLSIAEKRINNSKAIFSLTQAPCLRTTCCPEKSLRLRKTTETWEICRHALAGELFQRFGQL